MSYDLYFWRQEEGLALTPEEVLKSLNEVGPLDGVTQIDLHVIQQRLREFFPGIDVNGPEMEWEGSGSYFQVNLTMSSNDGASCATVCCGYKLLESEDTMNRIIEAFNSLGCALYDPQTGMRYLQPEPR